MRVYFTGASGAGKSSLAAHVKKVHGYHLVKSATRQAMEEWGLDNLDDLFRDVAFAGNFHLSLWRIQRRLEEEAAGQDRQRDFVSERCFDCVAYAAELSRMAWQITRQDDFDAYVQNLRARDAVVFFVRPQVEVPKPDGRRDRFLEPALVHRLDGAIQFLLQSLDVPHVNVPAASLRDREQLVDAVVSRLKT